VWLGALKTSNLREAESLKMNKLVVDEFQLNPNSLDIKFHFGNLSTIGSWAR
jgi:hypothetical protein